MGGHIGGLIGGILIMLAYGYWAQPRPPSTGSSASAACSG